MHWNMINSDAFANVWIWNPYNTEPVENEAYFYATFEAEDGTISSTVVKDGYSGMSSKVLDTIRLLGASGVTGITINGAAHTDFEVLASGEVLVKNMGVQANTPFVITY